MNQFWPHTQCYTPVDLEQKETWWFHQNHIGKLKNIDFLQQNMLLLGPPASGKSTLMYAMLNYLHHRFKTHPVTSTSTPSTPSTHTATSGHLQIITEKKNCYDHHHLKTTTAKRSKTKNAKPHDQNDDDNLPGEEEDEDDGEEYDQEYENEFNEADRPDLEMERKSYPNQKPSQKNAAPSSASTSSAATSTGRIPEEDVKHNTSQEVSCQMSDLHYELDCFHMTSRMFRSFLNTCLDMYDHAFFWDDYEYPCVILILKHVDQLSNSDQKVFLSFFDWVQKSPILSGRTFFWATCHQKSHLIRDLQSRFLCLHVAAPSTSELLSWMTHIVADQKNEAWTQKTADGSLYQMVLEQAAQQIDAVSFLLFTYLHFQIPSCQQIFLPWQKHLNKLCEHISLAPKNMKKAWLDELQKWIKIWFENFFSYTCMAYGYLVRRFTHSQTSFVCMSKEPRRIGYLIHCFSKYQLETQNTWYHFQHAAQALIFDFLHILFPPS